MPIAQDAGLRQNFRIGRMIWFGGCLEMAIRFRKRIKLMPGVHINLSKSGISTTVGPRGASVNVGKKGTYLTTSIPGTGISARTKLTNGKTRGAPKAVRSSETAPKPSPFKAIMLGLLAVVLVLFLLAAL